MTEGTAYPRSLFPGSDGAAEIVAWIDARLAELREGRPDAVLAAMEGGRWYDDLDFTGLSQPVARQLHRAFNYAFDAIRHPQGSAEEAETALLIARSHLLPQA